MLQSQHNFEGYRSTGIGRITPGNSGTQCPTSPHVVFYEEFLYNSIAYLSHLFARHLKHAYVNDFASFIQYCR